MTTCLLSIRVKMNTMFSERVVLVGNENFLGSWDPQKGLNLSTNPCEYPQWFLSTPLKFPKGSIVQFKFLVMKDDQIIRWESLPGKKNRHYYVVHDHALLNCQEGAYEGQEVIPRPRFKKMRSEPSQEDLSTSSTAQDFAATVSFFSFIFASSMVFSQKSPSHRAKARRSHRVKDLLQAPSKVMIWEKFRRTVC